MSRITLRHRTGERKSSDSKLRRSLGVKNQTVRPLFPGRPQASPHSTYGTVHNVALKRLKMKRNSEKANTCAWASETETVYFKGGGGNCCWTQTASATRADLASAVWRRPGVYKPQNAFSQSVRLFIPQGEKRGQHTVMWKDKQKKAPNKANLTWS